MFWCFIHLSLEGWLAGYNIADKHLCEGTEWLMGTEWMGWVVDPIPNDPMLRS